MTRAVALGLAVLFTALPGEAQVLTDVTGETPRDGGVDIRIGRYRPALDREAGLTGTPFADIFGDQSLWLFEVEAQRFFYQGIGTAGVGFSAGYAEKYASALLEGGERAAERTGLHVVPLRMRGLYRFDYPAFQWGFPLVPYIKPGLVYMPWWVTKGGEIEEVGGNQARGGRWGYEVVGGVSFLLDVLDPRLARDLDNSIGVNHSYFFVEYTYMRVDNFGRPGLNLSDSYWMFGLSLDY
jgi:hypothetical protein